MQGMRRVIALALATSLSAACTKAPAPAAPATQPLASVPEPAQQVPLEPLGWLAGDWCGGEGGELIQETWLPPRDYETIGMSRTLRDGKLASFEYMRITRIAGTITFIGQPAGGAPVEFKRTDGDDNWIRFENPQHDYPQRIQYRRAGDELHAEVGGPGPNGQDEIVPYTYKRCAAG
jgi:hypothetical protein